MIATKALRRKFDYQLLRWQARLDGEWADRVIPMVAAAGLFVVLAGLAVARARTFGTVVEMSRWVQGAWFVTHGQSPDLTTTGANLFEPQGAFGFAVIAQFARVIAPIPLLLVIQAGALALGIIPIWRLCRKVCSLRVGAATAAVIAYGAYPPLHQLNLADFHAEAVAVPLLLGGAYAGFRRHWWWATVFCVAAVSLRSDLGLVVTAIGVVWMTDNRSKQAPRFIVAGLAWTLLSLLVLQPSFGDGSFVHADAFAAYGSTLPGVVWGMVTDPLGVFADLIARENFTTVVALLAPVAFLSVLHPRYLFPVVPIIALLFVADVPTSGAEGVANLVPAIVFVFVALPFALARLGRRNIERITVDRRLLGALTLAALVFFVQDSPSSPYAEPWEWGGRDLTDQALVEAIAMIDDDAPVRATTAPLAELSWRPVLHLAVDDRSIGGRDFAADVDAILLDLSLTGEWNSFRLGGVTRAIENEGFDLVLDRHGVLLFLRSEPEE